MAWDLQVELGLVWVWPESSPEAWIESSAKQPALCQLVKDVDPGVRAPACALSLPCLGGTHGLWHEVQFYGAVSAPPLWHIKVLA